MCVTHACGSGRALDDGRWGPEYAESAESGGFAPGSESLPKLIARVPWRLGLSSSGMASRESMVGGERSGICCTRMRANGDAAALADGPVVAVLADGPTVAALTDGRRVTAVSGKLTRAPIWSVTIRRALMAVDAVAVREG